MKLTYARRYRRSVSRSREAGNAPKENQPELAFFAAPSAQSFFKPNLAVQRKCAHCEAEDKKLSRRSDPKEEEKKLQKMDAKKEEEKLQRLANDQKEERIAKKAENTTESPAITTHYLGSIAGKGSPLPDHTRRFFAARMGYDFTEVKIHTGKEAEQSAQEVNAQAYTHGQHIVFNSGKYQPESSAGKKLLAHELTHVVQQQKELGIAPKIARAPVEEPPVNTDIAPIIVHGGAPGSKKKPKEIQKEQKAMQEIATKSYRELNVWYDTFVNLWLTAANTALFQAEVPPDATQKKNYYTALAGNLLWATTSLNPAAKTAVIVMSFAGAYAGSGGLANEAAPTGIAEVASYLTKARDELQKKSMDTRQEVAITCALQHISATEQQKQVLWSYLFPGIAFNSSDQLRENSRQRLNQGLRQFQAQWQQWRTKIDDCKLNMKINPSARQTEELAQNEKPPGPVKQPAIQTKPLPDIQRQIIIYVGPDYTNKCEQLHPFNPKLNF